MQRKKLALIAPANSIHTQRWALSLQPYFDVTLISLSQHASKSDDFEKKVDVIYLPSEGKLAYLLNHFRLKKIAALKQFDIYNAHYASGYGTLLRFSDLTPSVINFWGSDIYEFPHRSILHHRLLYGNIKFAQKIVSTSQAMAKEILQVYPKYDEIIPVVPFGVDLEDFKYQPKTLDQKVVNLGTCKLLSPVYAIDDMIKAFALAKEALNGEMQLTLNIFGDGPSRSELEELTERLGVSNSVQFHGWTPHSEIPKALESIDIFCLTSLRESFGVSAIEAMAMGVPVVATNTVGFSEVIDHMETGIITPVADPPAMAEEIIRLIRQPMLYQSISSNGRSKIEDLYDWKHNVVQMVDILNEVLDQDK